MEYELLKINDFLIILITIEQMEKSGLFPSSVIPSNALHRIIINSRGAVFSTDCFRPIPNAE